MKNKMYQITPNGMLFCELYKTKKTTKRILAVSIINLIVDLLICLILMKQ